MMMLCKKILYRQLGIVIKIEQFDLKGNLISITDSEGHVWKKTYDDLGRLKSETDPEGNQKTWQYQGDTIKCTLPSKEVNIQRHQAGKVVESRTFDSEGNLIANILSEYSPTTNSFKEIKGNLCSTTWISTQGYPLAIEQGEIITIHHYDPMGQCVASIDSEGRCTQREFDSLGNLIQKILSDGSVIKYEYDKNSNLTVCALPGGILWKATYNTMGKKLSEELQTKNTISQNWKYIYESGRLIEAIDPNHLRHCYRYDDFGRKVEEEVNGKKRLFTYDLRGFITSAEQIDDYHTKIERSYDNSGRLTSEKIYLNEHLLQQTKQSWESSKRLLQIEDHQRIFTYLGGHLSQITVNDFNLAYLHDADGSLMNRSTNYADTIYQYHLSGLPKTMTTHAAKKQFEEIIQWDNSAKMSSYRSTWKGTTEEIQFSYNSRNQIQSINDEKYIFDFNNPGCGVRTESPNWTVDPKGMDPFGRIISEVSEGKKITTAYNSAGQVISRLSNAKQTFTWDSWGNLIEINTKTYTWKAFYDALGRRLQTAYTPYHAGYIFKTKGETQLTTSFYDPEKEFDEIGVSIEGKTFWKLIGNKNCEAIIDDEGNSVSLVYDALGKLIAVIDPERIHWNEKSVTPYGPRAPPESLESTLLSFALAHAWQGKRVDPTGFIWMGARYYDPIGGRFLSTDPIRIPITLELYSYANGDPVNFYDPDGRFFSAVYETVKPGFVLTSSLLMEQFRCLSPDYAFNKLSTLGTHTSQVYVTPGYCIPNKKIIYTGGILTSLIDSRATGNMLSELAGGHQVHVVHNPTNIMPTLDGLRWFASCKLNFQTEVVRNLRKESDAFFATASPDAHLLLIGFSEGCTHVRNFQESYDGDLRKRIDVLPYCPSAYTDEEFCASVTHFCSKADIVHKIVCEGFVTGQKNTVFLDPHPDAFVIDHAALSPTFKESLENKITNYLNE